MAECRRLGWIPTIVERRNPVTRKSNDAFGFGDILVIDGHQGSLMIQATSGSNGSARVRKIVASMEAYAWLGAGNRAQVWAWRKYARPLPGRRALWRPLITELSLSDMKGSQDNG